MIRRVIGTAGHIDHGKTALVKALTGIDTDRLKEEQERRISIDLGFAPLDLPGGIRAAVVDVPGHERFVKNMLAGVGGIDAVLFTVAADEGVMPQTSEHLEILHFLGVTEGLIVLTKADLVDEEMMELVRDEVAETFARTSLAGAPILAVSAVTGEGVEEVRQALGEILGRAEPRPLPPWYRLPVDRVFSSQGFGTVVTGTSWSGTVRVGDRLELLPQCKEVRVRNVEVFHDKVEEAGAGQRTALAIHGVSREEVTRGDLLVTPGVLSPTHMVDARFRLAESAKEVRNRKRIRFHHGSAEVLGRMILLEGDAIPPGEEGLLQFRLEEPVVLARGDRFIVRSYSPARTIGGGVVLDSNPPKRKPGRERDLELLKVTESGDPAEMVESLLSGPSEAVLPAKEIARRLQIPEEELGETLRGLTREERIRTVPGGIVLEESVRRWKAEIVRLAAGASRDDPLRAGVPREEVRKGLTPKVELALFQKLVDELVRDGAVTVRGEILFHGSGALPEGARAAAAKIEEALAKHGFATPSPAMIAEETGLSPREVASLLDLLCRFGRVARVGPNLYYRAGEMEKLEEILRKVFDEGGDLTVSVFKDLAGVSRKFAVPLLEHFDQLKITRREGDRRVPGPAWKDREKTE